MSCLARQGDLGRFSELSPSQRRTKLVDLLVGDMFDDLVYEVDALVDDERRASLEAARKMADAESSADDRAAAESACKEEDARRRDLSEAERARSREERSARELETEIATAEARMGALADESGEATVASELAASAPALREKVSAIPEEVRRVIDGGGAAMLDEEGVECLLEVIRVLIDSGLVDLVTHDERLKGTLPATVEVGTEEGGAGAAGSDNMVEAPPLSTILSRHLDFEPAPRFEALVVHAHTPSPFSNQAGDPYQRAIPTR